MYLVQIQTYLYDTYLASICISYKSLQMYVTAEYYKETETSNWRSDSRRRLRPRSNLIYPMRARSNIRYHSPPPPYEMYRSPPPGYSMPGQTLDPQQTDPEAQEEMEIPAEPEPDRNLDMVHCFAFFFFG